MIQKDDKRQIWSWAMYDFANSRGHEFKSSGYRKLFTLL